MVKLPGFLQHYGLEEPDVWVQDGGPRRTLPFLETVPFLRAAGYKEVPKEFSRVLREAYRTDGRTHFPNVMGVDWFLSYNGVLGAGRRLEDVDPEFGCEWRPPLVVSAKSREFQAEMQAAGPYVAVFLPDGGMYHLWWACFGPARMVEALRRIRHALGARIVFIGAEWDRGSIGWVLAEQDGGPGWENWIGRTDYDQLIGLLQGATAVVGYPAGNTILGLVWKVPTVLLWHQYFTPAFWHNTIPPDSPYLALDTRNLTVAQVVEAVQTTVGGSFAVPS
jgi:hypothetical protein